MLSLPNRPKNRLKKNRPKKANHVPRARIHMNSIARPWPWHRSPGGTVVHPHQIPYATASGSELEAEVKPEPGLEAEAKPEPEPEPEAEPNPDLAPSLV